MASLIRGVRLLFFEKSIFSGKIELNIRVYLTFGRKTGNLL